MKQKTLGNDKLIVWADLYVNFTTNTLFYKGNKQTIDEFKQEYNL